MSPVEIGLASVVAIIVLVYLGLYIPHLFWCAGRVHRTLVAHKTDDIL